LRRLRADQHAATAEIIVGSVEYRRLNEPHAADWAALRTTRAAPAVVVKATRGQLEQRYPMRLGALKSNH
jgi:hypothetical protein